MVTKRMDSLSSGNVVRLAILTTHPIQYNAPAFRALAASPGLQVRVFYEWEGPGNTIDQEFGRAITWDVPLFEGYDHEFAHNVASDPGTHHFRGIDNPEIVARIGNWRPDVVLVYGWSFVSHVRVLRAFRGRLPIVFRGDSTLLDERPGVRTAARRLLLRWLYAHIDVALYAGAANRAYFVAHGLGEHQLEWAPHAVDNERFALGGSSTELAAREWRARLGISPDHTVLLFAGKLSSRKNPTMLLRAFMEIKRSERFSMSHLVFIGTGALMAALRNEALGRSDIHFLGFSNQSAMPTAYRLGDVLVMPSLRGETWGLAVNEAMACGRPVVASDKVGCAPDLIQHGKTGFVVRHGDQVALEKTLRTLIGDSRLIAGMGANALALIQQWSIPRFAEITAHVVARNVRDRKN